MKRKYNHKREYNHKIEYGNTRQLVFVFVIFAIMYFISYILYPSNIFAQNDDFTDDLNIAKSLSAENELSDSLKRLIDLKSVQLQELQSQREILEKNIQDVSESNNSLSKEIKTIDYNISQLNLSIKANKLTLEKLSLEIDSIRDNIENTQDSLQNKKESVAKLFIELQQKDKENTLTLFLRSESLAEGLNETRTISTFNQTLSQNIEQLQNLQFQLSKQLIDEEQKKKNRETEKINLTNRQYIIQDQKEEKKKLLAGTKDQEKSYQKELQELVKKQQDIADEIEKIDFELRSKINPDILPPKTPGILGLPIINGRISQVYGKTTFAKYGYKGKFHNGLDFAVPIGTPIFATEKGTILAVDNQDKYKGCRKGAYGKYVVIKHENNLTTLYAHLSRYIVKKGDVVERGSLIGYVGATGYATGPHLHLTVYASPTFYIGVSRTCGPMPYGGDLNPAQYLDLNTQ